MWPAIARGAPWPPRTAPRTQRAPSRRSSARWSRPPASPGRIADRRRSVAAGAGRRGPRGAVIPHHGHGKRGLRRSIPALAAAAILNGYNASGPPAIITVRFSEMPSGETLNTTGGTAWRHLVRGRPGRGRGDRVRGPARRHLAAGAAAARAADQLTEAIDGLTAPAGPRCRGALTTASPEWSLMRAIPRRGPPAVALDVDAARLDNHCGGALDTRCPNGTQCERSPARSETSRCRRRAAYAPAPITRSTTTCRQATSASPAPCAGAVCGGHCCCAVRVAVCIAPCPRTFTPTMPLHPERFSGRMLILHCIRITPHRIKRVAHAVIIVPRHAQQDATLCLNGSSIVGPGKAGVFRAAVSRRAERTYVARPAYGNVPSKAKDTIKIFQPNLRKGLRGFFVR